VTDTAPASQDADPGVGPAPGLSVAEAARRVGVAGSTLRTWERRYGIRPGLRTSGGHRRYTLDDIAALQRLRGLIQTGMPTATAAARALGRVDRFDRADRATGSRPRSGQRLGDRLAAAVERLDLAEAADLAVRLVDATGVVAAWCDVFVPILQAAGDRWECSGDGVEREHVAAAAIQWALVRHGRRRSAPAPAVRVLAVATEREGHTLPLDAFAAALADAGVGACVLGTLPAPAVHAAIEDLTPAVVLVWARSRETSEPKLLRSLAGRVPVVCAAGPGWQPHRLPDKVTHLVDLTGAVSSVLAWTT
jgi:MerR family transcriptional regulator, light-induced transcriptional regulator